ncbi:hypothetical protein IWW47_003787, partial [Coemansia sp. RSA 2052]
GQRQALTDVWTIREVSVSYRDTITVHAPHPPSPQPSLVPVRPVPRKYCSSVMSKSGSSTMTRCPL